MKKIITIAIIGLTMIQSYACTNITPANCGTYTLVSTCWGFGGPLYCTGTTSDTYELATDISCPGTMGGWDAISNHTSTCTYTCTVTCLIFTQTLTYTQTVGDKVPAASASYCTGSPCA